MSLERLVDSVEEAADRRRFLKKFSFAALGVVTASLGLPGRAKALVNYQCCELCQYPSGSCTDCTCGTWCWTCCGNCLTGERWKCCECYRAPSCGCDAACSWAYIYDYSCTRCE
jgi:hypothetical protein